MFVWEKGWRININNDFLLIQITGSDYYPQKIIPFDLPINPSLIADCIRYYVLLNFVLPPSFVQMAAARTLTYKTITPKFGLKSTHPKPTIYPHKLNNRNNLLF